MVEGSLFPWPNLVFIDRIISQIPWVGRDLGLLTTFEDEPSYGPRPVCGLEGRRNVDVRSGATAPSTVGRPKAVRDRLQLIPRHLSDTSSASIIRSSRQSIWRIWPSPALLPGKPRIGQVHPSRLHRDNEKSESTLSNPILCACSSIELACTRRKQAYGHGSQGAVLGTEVREPRCLENYHRHWVWYDLTFQLLRDTRPWRMYESH